MKIKAIDIKGNKKEYEVILTYHFDDLNKDYIVYTDNIYNSNNELQIYISNYNKNNNICIVNDITKEKEYKYIKSKINSVLLTMKNEQEKLNKVNN